MSRKNGHAKPLAIVGASLAMPGHLQPDGVLVLEGATIAAAGPRATTPVPKGAERIDGRGMVAAPGLIDLHINGFGGVDVFGAGPADLAKMGRALVEHGVTSFLPTLTTSPFPALCKAIARLQANLQAAPAPGSAEPLGIYLEGPFLSDSKRGAHPSQDLRAPRVDTLKQLVDLMGRGPGRIATIAPELPGALDAIKTLVRAGIVVALGHSSADAALCAAAVAAGATHVTHLFNAMAPIHHRAPGLAGYTLGSPSVTAEIVADGHHVDRWMVAAAWRALGPDRLAIVSDALAPAGLPLADGATVRLESGLGRVTIRRAGITSAIPRAENGSGVLVGSIASLTDCVRFAVHEAGIPLADAIRMASGTPAAIAGVARRKGTLAAGFDADVLLLDGELSPRAVWVRGERVDRTRIAPARTRPNSRPMIPRRTRPVRR